MTPDIINQFFRLFSGIAVIQHTKGTEDDGDGQEKQQFHGRYSLKGDTFRGTDAM